MRTRDSVIAPLAAESGKLPDLLRSSPPIELPRVVMRGALAVAIGGLVLALLLGLWRARADMREETAAAAALARTMLQLAQPEVLTRAQLLAHLQALPPAGSLRHLQVQVRDADGRALLPEHAPPAPDLSMVWLVALNRQLFPPPEAQTVRWPVELADGARWEVELIASPDSEQAEALNNVLQLLVLLAGGCAVMLLVMQWNVRRSFRPLRSLLAAIEGVEQQRLTPLRALPAMPIRELEAIAAALRHLAGALQQAEEVRRTLSRQVLTLQEDERHRLARELHDELGQHLTALRVDAAWLARRLDGSPELAAVAQGMGAQCGRVQQEVRALLTRLRPLGWLEATGDISRDDETVGRLRALLESLVAAWSQSPGQATRYRLVFDAGGLADGQALPRALVLTVYRISQEALTNVARHSRARSALLRVRLERSASSDADAQGLLDWSVEDDGIGLVDASAWQRGNGMAGVKERVWAAAGDLQCEPASAGDAARPGLRLHARLPWSASAVPSAQAGA